jgi:hypothetical protein
MASLDPNSDYDRPDSDASGLGIVVAFLTVALALAAAWLG